jgi:hypothetical protein
LQVLNTGTVSTNMFLRRLHNFAFGMHWPPWPVLPKLHWPAVRHKDKRAITAAEHQTIMEREHNPEIRAYYEMLWHLGGAQTDMAELTAEDLDWKDRTVSYRRHKTGEGQARIRGGMSAAVLRSAAGGKRGAEPEQKPLLSGRGGKPASDDSRRRNGA